MSANLAPDLNYRVKLENSCLDLSSGTYIEDITWLCKKSNYKIFLSISVEKIFHKQTPMKYH